MKITYKKNLFPNISKLMSVSNSELIYKSIIERKETIEKLENLKTCFDDLEFIKQAKEIFYFWLYENDYKNICKMTLGDEDYLVSRVETDMTVSQERFQIEGYEYIPVKYYLNAVIAHSKNLILKERYTKEELESLMNDNKIIIFDFVLGRESIENIDTNASTINDLNKYRFRKDVSDEFDFEVLKSTNPKLFEAFIYLIRSVLTPEEIDNLKIELNDSLIGDLEIINTIADNKIASYDSETSDYQYIKQKSYQLIKNS